LKVTASVKVAEVSRVRMSRLTALATVGRAASSRSKTPMSAALEVRPPI